MALIHEHPRFSRNLPQTRRGPASGAVLFMVAAPIAALAARETATATNITPLVLVESSRVLACGVLATGVVAGAPVTVSFLNQRVGDRTELLLSADWPGERLGRIGLATSSEDTARLLPPASAAGASIIQRGDPGRDAGARLFQELMVSGADVTLERANGELVKFILPGPMPASIRAAYLNCAGDLFPQTR